MTRNITLQNLKAAFEQEIQKTDAYKSFKKIGESLHGYGSLGAKNVGTRVQSIVNKLGEGRTRLGDAAWSAADASKAGEMAENALMDYAEQYFDKVFGTHYASCSGENLFATLGIPQCTGSYTDGFTYSSSVGLESSEISLSALGYSGVAKINL